MYSYDSDFNNVLLLINAQDYIHYKHLFLLFDDYTCTCTCNSIRVHAYCGHLLSHVATPVYNKLNSL